MKKIFVITGEYSGDKHASNVVRELLKLNPDLQIEGVGGENLKNAGVKLFSDHSKMGKVGLTPKIILDHFSLGKRILDYLKNSYKPDLILMTDYGAFNLTLSKPLKKAGFECFYFIPPQVWASRKWRLKTIKRNIKRVFTIFPFENKMYEKEGIDSLYVGHPLIKELAPKADRAEFFAKHNLDSDKRRLAVFPGSRTFEIKYLLDDFISAAKKVQKACPDVQVVFSHAPNLSDNVFKNKLEDFKTIKGENQALLSVSDALILASGTVALEAALYETPMLIAYRGPIFFYLVYLLVRAVKKACLVNIITGKDIVEEFLMFDSTPEKIAQGAIKILNDKDARGAQINGLREVKKMLSEKHCVEEVAKNLYEELK
jgi:lipid-A-disaccharide synthase